MLSLLVVVALADPKITEAVKAASQAPQAVQEATASPWCDPSGSSHALPGAAQSTNSKQCSVLLADYESAVRRWKEVYYEVEPEFHDKVERYLVPTSNMGSFPYPIPTNETLGKLMEVERARVTLAQTLMGKGCDEDLPKDALSMIYRLERDFANLVDEVARRCGKVTQCGVVVDQRELGYPNLIEYHLAGQAIDYLGDDGIKPAYLDYVSRAKGEDRAHYGRLGTQTNLRARGVRSGDPLQRLLIQD